MPYASTHDLPSVVRDYLPATAQEIFRVAFNEAKQPGVTDQDAFTAAWNAVKAAGYSRGNSGMWEKPAKKKKYAASLSDALLDLRRRRNV